MSIYKALLRYLITVRLDADKPRDIDKLALIVKRLQKTPIEETQELSAHIAGFIRTLYHHMPEIHRADPRYRKLLPLFQYCETLPPAPKKIAKTKPTPKGPGR